MKINKKIVVPVLSTAAGLALLGGISGSVAWYQYNSRVTASIIGTSVANSGLLQISTDNTNWKRDVVSAETGSQNNNKLLPVTFGEMEKEIDTDGQTVVKDTVLPANAYAFPEAGHGAYNEWFGARKNYEYVQYDIYLKATQAAGTADAQLVSKPVYISDMVLEDATENKAVAEALRVHLAVENGKNFLISKTGIHYVDENDKGLPLFGKMDLDGDNQLDTKGGYEWSTDRNSEITYGAEGKYQVTKGMSEIVAPRNADGDIVKGDTETDEEFAAKKICDTLTTGSQKITVTVWLEGWHKFENADSQLSAIWESSKRAEASVHVGMTFDVGKNAFKA